MVPCAPAKLTAASITAAVNPIVGNFILILLIGIDPMPQTTHAAGCFMNICEAAILVATCRRRDRYADDGATNADLVWLNMEARPTTYFRLCLLADIRPSN
jgi:hypothetical protein